MTRLIDADALKVNEAHYDEEGVRIFYENEIDNAPTVTKDYDTGYQDGLEDGFNDIRPQGEWIEKVETKQVGYGWLTSHYVVCSVCGGSGENDEGIPQNWKYCPNCGADMRGEE